MLDQQYAHQCYGFARIVSTDFSIRYSVFNIIIMRATNDQVVISEKHFSVLVGLYFGGVVLIQFADKRCYNKNVLVLSSMDTMMCLSRLVKYSTSINRAPQQSDRCFENHLFNLHFLKNAS